MAKRKKKKKETRGRPSGPVLSPKKLRKSFPIRMSQEEAAKLEQAAESVEKPTSTWARETLLNEADRLLKPAD